MKTFLPLIIIGVCAGMYFMYMSPLIGDINNLINKKAEYTNVLSSIQDLKTKRDDANTAYSNIPESDIATLNKIVPKNFDGVLFLNNISNLAAKHSLKISNYTPNKPATASRDAGAGGSSYVTILISLKLSGSYDQFVSFLKELETSMQLVDVVGLTVESSPSAVVTNAAGKSVPNTDLQYTLDINTYSLN